MLVSELARSTPIPYPHPENVEARFFLGIVVFIESGNRIEGSRRQSNLLLAFPDQRDIEPLTLFDMAAGQIPLFHTPLQAAPVHRR